MFPIFNGVEKGFFCVFVSWEDGLRKVVTKEVYFVYLLFRRDDHSILLILNSCAFMMIRMVRIFSREFNALVRCLVNFDASVMVRIVLGE